MVHSITIGKTWLLWGKEVLVERPEPWWATVRGTMRAGFLSSAMP